MAENTKENLLKAPYIYYISNPKVPELYCLSVPMYVDLSEHIKNYELPNWHTKAPSKDLTNPVWSLDVADWVEADENSQGAILAEAQAKIVELDKSKEQLDQTLKSVQENQSNGTAQTLALTKSIKELSEGQANQNKLLASMQNLMLTIAGSQKTTAPKQATTATQPENN